MNKSDYIAKLEKEFKEMNTAFAELIAMCRDEKHKDDAMLQGVALLVEGIQERFKYHEDILLTVIESVTFR